MSEANSQEASAYRFVKTPLEFFGHGSELYFDYPPQFYEELHEAEQASEEAVRQLEGRRQELLATGDPESYEYQRHASDEQYAIDLRYVRAEPIYQLKHTWYERRMRGRFGDLVDPNEHPEAAAYCDWQRRTRYNQPIGPPSPRPEAPVLARYLNAKIANNAWESAYEAAHNWFDDLDDGHEDKQTARDYIGFTGAIILNEYCKIAYAYAHHDLGDNDFVSVKHLLTVCWPKAMDLEAFAPDEVAQKKRLLREIFLQFTLAGGDNVRHYASMLRYLPGEEATDNFEDREQNENEMLNRLMRFDEADEIDKTMVLADVTEVSTLLEKEKRWHEAINMLDLAQMAFALPREAIQKRIDEVALNAALALTDNMNTYEDQRLVERRGETYVISDNDQFLGLTLTAGISREVKNKLYEIEDTRKLEYQVQQIVRNQDGTDDISHQHQVFELFERLQRVSPELARRFADPEAIKAYMDLLCEPAITKMYASSFDNMVEEIIILRNKGVLSTEQQNQLLLSLADNLLTTIKTGPRDLDEFDRIIGYLSPIMRATKRRESENPDEEVLWRLMPQSAFADALDALITYAEERERPNSVAWFKKQKAHFLADPRQAWHDFWEVRVEY